MTGDPGLADLYQFIIKRDSKTGNIELLFLDGNKHWQSFTNERTGEFLASKTSREKFGGLSIMKSVLSLHKTSSALERLIDAATKIKGKLPTDLEMESIALKELSSLAEEIHVKKREAWQNTDLDMREFLEIDKALQSIQSELLNNTSKLTEIDKRIQRDTKMLQEVENDPTYSDEQRQLYKDRLDDRKTGKARNTVTKSKRSSNSSCENQANP